MEKIIIYTNETCPYCKTIKEEFNKQGIEFENRFTKDYQSEWGSITNLTGMPQVPTVLYKDNYFLSGRDFSNPNHIINILKNFEPSDSPVEEQVLERVKTLTYNIQTAFTRTDQLLRQIETKLNTDKDVDKSTN